MVLGLTENVFIMEVLFLVVLWVLGGVAIGAWARAWGRDFFSYALLGGLVSPLIGAIVLLIKGRLTEPEPRQFYKDQPRWDRPNPDAKNFKKDRICPHCSKPINTGAAQCEECGAKIGWHRAEGTGVFTPSVSRAPEPQKTKTRESDEKVCPDCAETIKAAAKVCRYCGYRFET